MKTLQALKYLNNKREYGVVEPGGTFTCDDGIARQLIRNGRAREVTYETKVIVPEVQTLTAEPFRYVPVLDPEPSRVAPESDRVLSESDVPEPGTPDRGKRAGRKAPGTER
jgi:hypothetical protein